MHQLTLGSTDFLQLSADILGAGQSFSFTAHGLSMTPFIRDGDVLTVEPLAPAALQRGDVVLYRRDDHRAAVHRVAAIDTTVNHTVVAIQADGIMDPAEHVMAQQILGAVTRVQRGQDPVRINTPLQRLWICCPSIKTAVLTSRRIAVALGVRALGLLQSVRLYRLLMRRCVHGRITYRVADSCDASAVAEFYRRYNRLGPLVPEQPSDAYVVVAVIGGSIVGAITLSQLPDDAGRNHDGWLSGAIVRARWRGAGIGEALTKAALAAAREHRAETVRLLVFDGNRPASHLYRKLGFERDPSPPPGINAEGPRDQEMPRRIPMRKILWA